MDRVKKIFNRFINTFVGIFLILISIFILLSIIFYNKNDPSLNTVTNNTIIYNKTGIVGSYISDFFIQIFGFTSIFIVLIFLKVGYNLITGKFKIYNICYKIIMLILFIVTSSVLVYKNVKYKLFDSISGGILGFYVGNLISVIPNYIVLIVFLFIDIIALTILFDKSFKIWKVFIIKSIRRLKDFLMLLHNIISTPFKKILNIKNNTYESIYREQNKKIKELEEYINNLEHKNNFNEENEFTDSDYQQDDHQNDYKNKHIDEKYNYTENLNNNQNLIDNNEIEEVNVPVIKREMKEKNKSNLLTKGIFKFGKGLKKSSNYVLPTTNILKKHKISENQLTKEELRDKANELKKVLAEFKINGKVISVKAGPIITLFEFEPSAGIKSSRIIGLSDDVARSLRVKSTRISVMENKNAMGIEIPNKFRDTIYLKEILESDEFENTKYILPIILGTSIAGEPVVIDLAKAPHLLIAGTTGSGKSVSINTMILSLLYKFTPDECKFIMIDPKMLELSAYEGIPHLLTPVVTEPHKAIVSLRWVVSEMENRYRLMSNLGVRNIGGFNEKVQKALEEGKELSTSILIGYNERGEPIYENKIIETKLMPYIVVVVDEMADLMITAGKDIEALVQRIAQMARAAGIHIIMATQRPSVDVITGVIKANFPSRVSFLVSSKIDSKVIIGEQGAEQLLGYGDMLYSTNGVKLTRAHGPFVSDEEVENVVKYIKSQGFKPSYVKEILEEENDNSNNNFEINFGGNYNEGDEELYKQAIQIVLRDKKTSISYLQRVLRIGYNKAATMIERMEKEGILSEPNTKGIREIL